MRFLCLHGRGTSAAIFKAQTSAFREKLDPQHYQFDFVDAPFRSPAAPGIDIFFSGPYYAFWLGQDTAALKEAHKWLDDLLKRQGPYDAIMGFSQGCALAATYILYHNKDRAGEPLPFKAAMFICGGYPLNVLTDLGIPVSGRALEIDQSTRDTQTLRTSSIATYVNSAMEGGSGPRKGLWDDLQGLSHDVNAGFPADVTDIFGLDYTWFPESLKIQTPTVHVYGRKDPRYPSSAQLFYLADESRSRKYDHEGGHDIPRTTLVSNAISGLVEWLRSVVE